MKRLAIMAAERLLLLQPANWTLRRDYGLLLHYARKYRESAQELSICLAFAPVEEIEVIEPFFGNERIIILATLSTSHGSSSKVEQHFTEIVVKISSCTDEEYLMKC